MSRGLSVRGCGLRLQKVLSSSPSVTSGQLRTLHRWGHRRTTTTLSVEAKKKSGVAKRKKKEKEKEKEKVIVISGPTGAGKSRLALELAKRLNGQITSADSVQVYRGLDIGSAKPSTSEREAMEYLPSCRQDGGRTSPGDFYAFLTEFQKASRRSSATEKLSDGEATATWVEKRQSRSDGDLGGEAAEQERRRPGWRSGRAGKSISAAVTIVLVLWIGY